MAEIDKMIERAKIEAILRDFSKEDRSNIIKDVDEYKYILGNEEVSTEIIAFIIFLYKKNHK